MQMEQIMEKTVINVSISEKKVIVRNILLNIPSIALICASALLRGDTRLIALLAILFIISSIIELIIFYNYSFNKGPRLIEIDILFYDDRILQDDTLAIPHPFVHERVFVLAPLADIAPHYQHPQTHKTVAQMLADVSSSAAETTTAVYRLPDQPNFLGTGV